MVEPNLFSIGIGFFSPYIQKMHHFTYTKHKAPDNGEVHREIQSVGRNLLCMTLQAPRIWRCSQIFGKLCVPLL
jgi:hypothetical protein